MVIINSRMLFMIRIFILRRHNLLDPRQGLTRLISGKIELLSPIPPHRFSGTFQQSSIH